MEDRLTDEQRRLVEEHLDLAEHAIREPLARVPDWADKDHLRGVAREALVRVVLAHDPSRGPFGPYARTRIWGAVMDELRAAAPRSRREHAEGAEAVSRPQLTSLEALEAGAWNAGKGTIGLSRAPAEPDAVERDAAVRRALEIFPHTERQVLVGHFVLGRPAAELARALGVSERQVRRTRDRAVLRLRRALAARNGAAASPLGGERPVADSPLAPRELEVLRWAARGASARETASRLGRGAETITSQRKRVIGKLGARNMAHAIAIAFRRGLLP